MSDERETMHRSSALKGNRALAWAVLAFVIGVTSASGAVLYTTITEDERISNNCEAIKDSRSVERLMIITGAAQFNAIKPGSVTQKNLARALAAVPVDCTPFDEKELLDALSPGTAISPRE